MRRWSERREVESEGEREAGEGGEEFTDNFFSEGSEHILVSERGAVL